MWAGGDNTVIQAFEAVVKAARDARVPIVTNDIEPQARASLLAVGLGFYDSGAAAADVAARVLGGTSPADIPFANVAMAQVSVNLDVARQLGVHVPNEVLEQARTVVEHESATFQIFGSAPVTPVQCTVVGDPTLLHRGGFGAEHCRRVSFPPDRFGFGLGAFGGSFADCQAHFGEFLAVAGAAAHLPGNGANVPDAMVTAGGSAPEVNVLYGLTCDGALGRCARFVAKGAPGAIRLSRLLGDCLDIAGQPTVAAVVVAESAGLIGAALSRSPAMAGTAEDPLGFPQVRDWMTFTAELAYVRNLALVVGVVSRAAPPELQPLLRPLGEGAFTGHVHAAMFSFRPLPRGALELRATVEMLFEGESPLALLHLVHDDRPVVGSGESELVRGVCWVGPVGDVRVDGPP